MAKTPSTKTKSKAKAGAKKAHREQPAADKRERFIAAYLKHCNASRAYLEAGYNKGSGLHQNASNLLRSHYVQERLNEERAKAAKALEISVIDIFKQLKSVAFSDIAALTAYHTCACRYCNGVDHAYQWRTPREYEQALADAINESDRTGKHVKLPTNEGGYGYSTHLAPNPDCPECDGRGIREVVFKDTRLLTEEERAVFAGVEVTQTGIKYRFEDRAKALESLAQHLQFYRERDEANGKMVANWLDQMAAAGRIQGMPIRKDEEKPE